MESALRLHGLGLEARQVPQKVEQSVQQLTLRCLTEPFSKEFVTCVRELGSVQACRSNAPRVLDSR